ncbi:unnamed protein product, partial [Prorocentrum cordatum]
DRRSRERGLARLKLLRGSGLGPPAAARVGDETTAAAYTGQAVPWRGICWSPTGARRQPPSQGAAGLPGAAGAASPGVLRPPRRQPGVAASDAPPPGGGRLSADATRQRRSEPQAADPGAAGAGEDPPSGRRGGGPRDAGGARAEGDHGEPPRDEVRRQAVDPLLSPEIQGVLGLRGRPRVRPPQGRGRGRGVGAPDGPVVLGWVADRPGREAARGGEARHPALLQSRPRGLPLRAAARVGRRDHRGDALAREAGERPPGGGDARCVPAHWRGDTAPGRGLRPTGRRPSRPRARRAHPRLLERRGPHQDGRAGRRGHPVGLGLSNQQGTGAFEGPAGPARAPVRHEARCLQEGLRSGVPRPRARQAEPHELPAPPQRPEPRRPSRAPHASRHHEARQVGHPLFGEEVREARSDAEGAGQQPEGAARFRRGCRVLHRG